MKALVLEHGHLDVREMAEPRLEPGDALIRVEAAGICATDLKIWHNGHRLWGDRPAVLGHEVVGRVVQVAGSPAHPRVGDRVVLAPNVGCGQCSTCRRGWDSLCPDFRAVGVGLDGGMAEFVRVPARAVDRGSLVPCPEHLPAEVATMAEPLSTCYRGLRQCGLAAGESALIIGAGPMGLFAALLAQSMGACPTMVAEVAAGRREFARSLGVGLVIDPAAAPLPEQVRGLTGGEGADVVMVAVGLEAVQHDAILSAAVGGRINLFAGLPSGAEMSGFPSNLVHYRQLAVVGTTGSTPGDMSAVVQLMANGRLRLEQMASHRFALEEAAEAFATADSRQGMRVVLSVSSVE